MATNNNTSAQTMTPVIFSSTVGTAIEWYDFFLYGTMATLVFPKVFFPASSVIVGTFLSLFTFLVGFIARPFGGALFGHFGDRVGRKSTLIATLLLMGISTLIIGFLPGFATIGIAAPLILVLLRLGQGLGVGGEWGGSVLLALEYGHRGNRGFWASWPQMGVPIGLILSTVIVNIVQGAAGARFVEQAPFYLFTTFVITYGVDKLLLDRTLILNAITIAAFVELFTIPLFGYLSEYVGRRRWYLIGCVLMAAFAFPYFLLMNTKVGGLFILAVAASLAIFHAWVYGPQAALIAERFGTRSRYSGASLGYQLAAPFAGGLAPIIALLLLNGKTTLSALGLSKVVINIGGGSWQSVSIYIVVLGVISFVSVLGLKELTKADISNVEAFNITEDEIILAPTD